ncbi:cip1-interacting zinc finger protein isoform X1 [Falco naumanni]|uniref:cip1-interacting zinc finger protein isoform X1 n=2 Tax=Falco naumanni TaxID=148594 RepID=UPI001ADE89B8|nr:cip1-interacting zinc finger protein isoform X1 [Falco naumanni]
MVPVPSRGAGTSLRGPAWDAGRGYPSGGSGARGPAGGHCPRREDGGGWRGAVTAARPARGSPDMFNQQQFQQQLLQLQHLLQQQQHHHHPAAQQGGRGLPPPQQQQMLSLRATNQPSLLNANPMLQRALLMQQMQGNLRGFNMTAPALQQFFPQATRHSLLGPPPVGVSLKPTRLGFPGLPFQRQNRTFRKDFQRVPDRKRELDPGSSSQAQGDEKVDIPEGMQAGSEQNNSLPSTEPRTPTESVLNTEPAAKRLKSATEEAALEDATGSKEAGESSAHVQADGTSNAKEYTAEDLSKERKFSEEPKAPEQVLSSGGSLKVTIQQSSESRAISTTALKPGHWTCEVGTADPNPESVLKFYCYICKTNCCSQQNFQSHMAGIQHQQRLGEIQHMSNVCFVSLLPMVKEQKVPAEKDGETQQRWCNTCQIHFTGDLIKHRRTQEHKLAKRALRPFCTVCSRHFKTPRKFVEHMKSPEHKQKAKEVRLGEKELGSPEDSEELITVDAVGCFEDDDDEEEEEEGGAGEEEDLDVVLTENEDSATKQTGLKEVSLEDYEGSEKYCPDTAYGLDFLVPVAGYLCRLCHKFYHSDSAARLAHCKSLMHFENFQRYKAARHHATAAYPEAPLHSQGSSSQLLDDPKQPPATAADTSKMNDDRGIDKEGTELSALQKQALRSPEGRGELAPSAAEGKSLGSMTDDVCGIAVVEEENLQEESKSTAASADCPLPEENRTAKELLGHAVCKEEADAAEQSEDTEDCQDLGSGGGSGQNEAANAGQEAAAEPSSLAKGETASLASAGCRRSTRRKPR